MPTTDAAERTADAADTPDATPEKVVVGTGTGREVYHRDRGDGTPACCAARSPKPGWRTVPLVAYEGHRRPCRNRDCFGDGSNGRGGDQSDPDRTCPLCEMTISVGLARHLRNGCEVTEP